MSEPSLSLSINPGPLTELVRRLVAEAVANLESQRQRLPDRLAFSEAEAARLLGLNPHQLRDERRRGRIEASEVVGRRIRYLREDLMAYLMRHRSERD
jgi:hypothetical protein